MDLETLIRESDPARRGPTFAVHSVEARALFDRIIGPQGVPPVMTGPTHGAKVKRALVLAGVMGVAVTAVLVSVSGKTTPAGAATVLRSAAEAALTQPGLPSLQPGQYYFEKTVALENCSLPAATVTPRSAWPVYLSTIAIETWTATDGSGREQSAPEGAGHFQTAAQQATWAASGQTNECVESADRRAVPPRSTDDPGTSMLPTDPATLGALIAAGRVNDVGQVTGSTGKCPSQNGRASQVFAPGQVCSVAAQFDIVNNLLGVDPEAPAELGPVLYRVLAQLPGVEIIGTRTDTLGRTGTAIEDPGSGDAVVLDPTSGALLETETVATPATSSPGVPPGTILQSATYGTVSVVGALGDPPS
jgi:hypothetical protein